MHKSRRQNAQGWAGHKSETSFGTKLVLHRCTWTYIGGEVHGRTLFNSATDGGGSKQKRDLGYAQISSLNSVQGRTLFNSLFQKAYG